MTIHSKPVRVTFAFLYQLEEKVYLKMTEIIHQEIE